MGAQPVFQAAYDLPLILERLSVFDLEFDSEEGDHWVLGRYQANGSRLYRNALIEGRPRHWQIGLLSTILNTGI